MNDNAAIELMNEAIAPFINKIDIKNIILCGDFNARLGRIVGDHDTNSRCNIFLDFISEHGLTIQNIDLAYGQHTLISNTGSSTIDFFITSNDDLVVSPYMEIRDDLHLNSDHKLVFFSFKHDFDPPKISVSHPRQLWKINKFKPTVNDRHIKPIIKYRKSITQAITSFQQKLDIHIFQKMHVDNRQQYLDELNQELTDIIYEALDNSVGKKDHRDRNWNWFWTQDLKDATEKREKLYRKWYRSNNLNKLLYWNEFQEAAENVRLMIQRSRNKYFRQFCDKLATNEFSKATNKIKNIRRGKSATTSTIQHIDGPQAAVDHITDTWKQIYDGNNLNPENEHVNISFPTNNAGFDGNIPFDIDDVKHAIKHLPTNKAPSHDHLKAEMLKPINDIISPILHQLFFICWKFALTPTSWNVAQVIPIYKKGDTNDPTNYRPISLICIFRKTLEICLYNILLPHSVILDPVQGGFRSQRSTLDHALCLQELMIHYKKKNGEFPVLTFLDIKSAYDTVDRNIIWNALKTNNNQISTPFLTMLQLMFNNVQIEVLLKGIKSTTPFNPATGVLQGSTLSPHLYSIYINSLASALRDIPSTEKNQYAHIKPHSPLTNHAATNPKIPINSLLFADDVVFIGSRRNTQLLLDKAQMHSFKLGYKWNPAKSAIILPPDNRTPTSPPPTVHSLYTISQFQ